MDDVPGPPKRPAPIPGTGLNFTSPNPEPADPNAAPAEPAWQRATFTSLADAEPFLNQLATEKREPQLGGLGPDLFVVEWR